VVTGQAVVDGKSNEITAFAPLLGRINITGVIVTADALHTQHRHADYLTSRGAHYVLMVKRNQPACTANYGPCPGPRSLRWTSPATKATAASNPAASASPPCPPASDSPTPTSPSN
jgi:hypothetical protein